MALARPDPRPGTLAPAPESLARLDPVRDLVLPGLLIPASGTPAAALVLALPPARMLAPDTARVALALPPTSGTPPTSHRELEAVAVPAAVPAAGTASVHLARADRPDLLAKVVQAKVRRLLCTKISCSLD